jgi:hypothetical protein
MSADQGAQVTPLRDVGDSIEGKAGSALVEAEGSVAEVGSALVEAEASVAEVAGEWTEGGGDAGCMEDIQTFPKVVSDGQTLHTGSQETLSSLEIDGNSHCAAGVQAVNGGLEAQKLQEIMSQQCRSEGVGAYETKRTLQQPLSLEWLREAGEDRVSSYLMNVAGLGRKSTG